MLASIGNGLGVWQNHGDMGVANTAQYQTRIPVSTAVDVLPPYAVVRLVSSATDESVGETVWTVAATDEDSDPHVYVLGNKTLTNASGDRGDAMFWPLGRIAYDPADGEPAINETWGPKAGEYLLRKGYLGFRCAGEADGNTAVFARTSAGDADLIVRITGSVRVAAGSGGSDCEGSAFEADASGNWPSGVGSMGSGVGHNAYTGYLQRRECLLDPWEDYGDEVYVDDMNGRKLVVGDRYQVVRQGSVGGVASYTTRDDPAGSVASGDSGDSGDSGSGSGDDCEEIHVLDCPASGSGDSGSGSGDGCVYVGEVSISNVGGVCTGTFTLTIPTRIVRVPRCSNGGSA